MVDLLPGRTAVIAQSVVAPEHAAWGVSAPLLVLDATRPGLVSRVVRAGARRLGLPSGDTSRGPFRRFLLRHRVQAVMGEYLDFSLPFLTLARSCGCRFWAHALGWDVSAALREERWRIGYLRYREADGIVTMSETSRRRLIELGLEPARVHAVPYGVDVPDLSPERTEAGRTRCLAVGRMVPKKAPILTLAAFKAAAERSPGLLLDYVGGGELLAGVEQFVRAYRLGDRVTLHGVQGADRVRALMARADIFLQHSVTDPVSGDEEGLPVAILEAMAAGLPVISTRHAGIPEAVIDGQTGFLVDEGDYEAMGDRIVQLAGDPDARRRLGLAGWSRARERFTWARERADLLRLLQLPG
ncbi:MAG: glycosyltransferase family 4 protein [Gammaproteobacteria bacterium]|nr:glycosyltransferase family 4 protein [Gammaproteobacteria bacterium]